MPFTQFVEVGRLALVSFGEHANKPVVVVDIVDHNRVIIDLAQGEAARQTINVKRLKLTDFVVKIERAATIEAVRSAIEADGVVAKWNATKWAKRLNNEAARVQMNDFQRFKHAKLIAKRDELVKAELAKH